jgi:hypothetical protein
VQETLLSLFPIYRRLPKLALTFGGREHMRRSSPEHPFPEPDASISVRTRTITPTRRQLPTSTRSCRNYLFVKPIISIALRRILNLLTLSTAALKRLASAVRFRPWPLLNQSVTSDPERGLLNAGTIREHSSGSLGLLPQNSLHQIPLSSTAAFSFEISSASRYRSR